MLHVVIADDEEKVCQLICGLINWEAAGMQIVGIAHDGIEALNLVETLQPDLLISDIRMPGYDGLELIARAKQLSNELDIIIISGYRHFEYAQTAIKYGVGDYLLKPINQKELELTLAKITEKHRRRVEEISAEEQRWLRLQSDISKLRTGFFTNMLLSRHEKVLVLADINKTYHYAFKKGSFQVVIMKLDCDSVENAQQSLHVLREKAISLLKHLAEPEYDMGLHCENSRIYCVLNFDSGKRKQIRKKLRTLLDEMLIQKSVFDHLSFTVCCGGIVSQIAQLPESLRQAQSAVEERLVVGVDRLIERVEERTSREKAVAMLAHYNKALHSAIAALDREGVLHSIDLLGQSLHANTDIGGKDIWRLFTEAANTFLVTLRSFGYSLAGEENFYETFREQADLFGTADRLLQFLHQTVGQALDQVIENKRQAETKPIRLVKQYIQQQYNSALTLEEVSRIAGFSPAYFSSLFKKETGSNFLEYLSKVRMDKAKELLKETDRAIAVICQDVGYSDVKHFTKSFKKATGLNPNAYRKLYS